RRAGAATIGNADLVIEAVDQRGFPQRSIDGVAGLPGVVLVDAQVQKRTYFRTQSQRGFVELIGIDTFVDPQIHPFELTEGEYLNFLSQNSVLLVSDWAHRMGLKTGDHFDLLTTDG